MTTAMTGRPPPNKEKIVSPAGGEVYTLPPAAGIPPPGDLIE